MKTSAADLVTDKVLQGADDQKGLKQNKTKLMSTIKNISMFNLHYQSMMPWCGTSKIYRHCSNAAVVLQVSIRQHTSSYVSIRQHTSAYVAAATPLSFFRSAYVSIRQHTSAYVCIRQHTSRCGHAAVVLQFFRFSHSSVYSRLVA